MKKNLLAAAAVMALNTAYADQAGVITPASHIEVRTTSDFSHISECSVTGTEVKCKGRLEKLPPNTLAYEAQSKGKAFGNVLKLSTASVTRVTGRGQKPQCESQVENSWPETITLKANHEAIIKTGAVKSEAKITGPAGCARMISSTYPETTIAGTWRAMD